MDNRFTRYVQIAMAAANYEHSESGFHGEIPGFYGLRAQSQTEQECKVLLQAALEAWLKYRAQNDLTIPAVGGFRWTPLGLEPQEENLVRLNRLESEIESLRIDLQQEPRRGKLILGTIRRLNQWYKSYWQLLVSLASLGIIAVAYWAYGVDPIQSYRETGDKIRMSERYVEIGDQLLLHSGSRSPEAEKAYQAALELYPPNMDARYGLLKSQILNPEPGRNDYDIGTAQAKLSAARVYIGDDYYLSYVEGVIAMNQAVTATGPDQESFGKKAKDSFEKSIKLKPEFSGNHLGLGRRELYFQRPTAALEIFNQAYSGKHSSPAILTYMGSLNASYRQFDEAVKYLREANTLSTRLDTLIVLGDVFRNKSADDPQSTASFLRGAISRHKEALLMANRTNLVKGVDYDEFLYTFMPKSLEAPKDDLVPMPFSTLDQFKVLANYCLSFDYVLANDTAQANTAFAAGFALDSCPNGFQKKYKYWYENQVDYLIRERKDLSAKSKEWLEASRKRFESCQ